MTENFNPEEFKFKKDFSSVSEIKNYFNLPDSPPLVVVDRTLKICFSNFIFHKYFNLSEGEILNYLPSDPNIVEILSTFAESKYSDFTFEACLNHNQDKKYYNIDIERIFIEHKEYFVILLHSLNEKNLLEEKIIDLNNALEFGVIPVIIMDENGIIKYSTKAFEELFNTNIEEIYNKTLEYLLHNYLTPIDKEKIEESFLNKKNWVKVIEVEKGNQCLFIQIKLVPIYKENSDNHNYLLIAEDLTDYFLKNKIIEKSEKQLKSIINNISDLLLILREVNGQIIFENANNNFFNVFEFQKNLVLKKNISDVLPEYLTEKIKDQIKDSSEEDIKIYQFDIQGEIKKYSVNYSKIDDPVEDGILFILSFRDVTAQKKFEEQLQVAYKKEAYLNQLKTSFLENMSHEIRTPFNAIMGYSEIIDDYSESGDYKNIKELTLLVKDVLKRILNLFNNIVEVSQIESGDYDIEIEEINCNQVLRNVYNRKKESALAKKLDFKLNLETEEFLIKSDAIKIDKIINALVDNSIKYTESGEVKISSFKEGDKCVILVSDTGIGIEEKQISRVIQPFSQEEEGYSRSYEGAGLGLTIAYKLVKILKGEFNISSSRNSGTYITVILPMNLTNNVN